MVIQEALHRIQSWQRKLEEKVERRAVEVKVKRRSKKLKEGRVRKIEKTELELLRGNQDRLLTHVIIGYIVDILLILFLIVKG